MELIRTEVTVKVIDHEETGKQIRTCRKAYDLNADVVSKAAGISRSYLMMLECGDRPWTDHLFGRVVKALQKLTGKKNP
jgi:transcriptional regulator with XRE-family HTH domain